MTAPVPTVVGCGCSCGGQPTLGRRYLRGHNQGLLAERECDRELCLNRYRPTASSQRFCSTYCKHSARRNWRLDDQLKLCFVHVLDMSRISLPAAALILGI